MMTIIMKFGCGRPTSNGLSAYRGNSGLIHHFLPHRKVVIVTVVGLVAAVAIAIVGPSSKAVSRNLPSFICF